MTPMSVDFQAYLDAKFPLDERSLNRDVRALFEALLGERAAARLLDIGAGTGASLDRLLALPGPARLEVTFVDRDGELLDLARRRAEPKLAAAGFAVGADREPLQARRATQTLTLAYRAADLGDYRPAATGHWDGIIAHALMDLLPPGRMARRMRDWLKPGGLVYATLNYDGGTVLFPGFHDAGFEDAVLAHYDASMARQLDGEACGGAQSGRRLHAALLAAGFELLAYGSSDWNITPCRGAYRDDDARCLRALLDMIHDEAQRSGRFDAGTLDAWWQLRREQIDGRQLGLIIHQLDLLARKPAA